MKNSLKLFVLFIFLINLSCKGQQMVQTTKEVNKLEINEQQFINKPLKYLLKELKPQIKSADATDDFPDYFGFRFRTLDQRNRNEGSPEDRVSLYVYVKEPIDWVWEKRQKGNELMWTKEDAEKYGNLTVVRIKVYTPPQE
ncbi:hypothetical protein D3C85_504830 [compost metagenome]